MKTICLGMIVKNEAHIILNTLHHLSKYITFDYWVINDNGSTDGTQEIITTYFKEKGIPGELDETPWKDFAYNRTIVFQRAYQKTDYVFVWDADDEIHGTFSIPAELTYDSYHCTFGNHAGLRYSRKQLFSNHLKWVYRGVLHEYPVCSEKADSSSSIHGAYYFISGRTGNRNKDPNKYQKDALLLEKAFGEETEDGIKNRYAFYTAQSYNSANINEKAIEWYKKVLTLSGWVEEKYISCITIYDLYEKQNKYEEGLPYLVESFIHNNIRVEGMYRLIKYYCIKKQHAIAYAYYTWIQKEYETKYKEERHANQLFVKKEEYDFYLPYYMIIVSERLKKMDTFSTMYEIIFNKKYVNTNAWWIHNLFNNIQFGIASFPKDLAFLESMLTYMIQLQHNNIVLKVEHYRIIDNIITHYRPLLTAPIHRPISLHKNNKVKVMFTMTTCKRYDLFQQTVHSIKRNWKDIDQIDYFFCVDDNSSVEDRANMQLHYPFFDYYMKTPEERGHRESMNIIWNKLKEVQPTYWIHMEDDWAFFKEEQYVTKSIEMLEKYENQNIHQLVFNREYGLMMEDMQRVGGRLLEPGIWLHEQKPVQGRNCAYWPHYSLQPSMVRTKVILELGDYTSPNTFFERDYANKYGAKGYQTMFFNCIYSIHIGKQHWEKDGKNAYALNNVQQLNTKPKILTTYRKYFDSFFLFLESDLAPSSRYPIHVGREPSGTAPYILYNTEQLSRSSDLERILVEIKKTNPKEIWDYSIINCSILKMHGIDAKHIPIQIPKTYVETCKQWRSEIKYDFGFCGQLSNRRMCVLDALKKKGYSVNCITLFGEERDKELATCRIHLNIHCEEDYQLFESARCELWLQVGVPMISENSLDNDSRCTNVPYEDIVDTAINVLQKVSTSIGFIMLRHVNSELTNKYWITCYDSIRRFYPENNILIIDDNSDKNYITEYNLYKTTIINSEYHQRGELLPYYYYLHNKLFDTAVILHDSVFINKYIDFHVDKYKLIWDFDHTWDQVENETEMITLLNDKDLLAFYENKKLWRGCYGGMSIITFDFLQHIHTKYNLSILLNSVINRYTRSSFERVIGCLLQKEHELHTLLGYIGTYCKWGIKYHQKDEYKHLPLTKVWTGR